MKLLETEWTTYRLATMPKNAPSDQLTQNRRAFFAGAWAIYALMMNRLEDDGSGDMTDNDMKFMEKLDAEMREFGERAMRGEV